LAQRSAPDLETRVQTICLVALASIAVAAALFWLSPVMIPFVLSVMISLGLGAAVDLLVRRLHVPRKLALPATLVVGVLFLAGVGAVVFASVQQLSGNADVYAHQVHSLLLQLTAILPEHFRSLPAIDGKHLADVPVAAVGGLLARTTNAILGLFSKSLLVLVFVVFLVMSGAGSGRPVGTWGDIQLHVQTYLVRKVVLSAVTGGLVGLTLGLLGVPLAMVFGLLAFLLNFIPTIGSVVATLLPLPVVLVTPGISTAVAVLAIAIPAGIQAVIGNVVEPMVVGEPLDLHPVTVLLGLIVWGMLWGVIGMFLATPIMAVMKILLEKFEGARPVAELLAGRVGGAGGEPSTGRSAG
jgi:AI-2 transport protein TqsA